MEFPHLLSVLVILILQIICMIHALQLLCISVIKRRFLLWITGIIPLELL